MQMTGLELVSTGLYITLRSSADGVKRGEDGGGRCVTLILKASTRSIAGEKEAVKS
ncbi:hypothetical protein M3J07_006772 [Ascochyta lentis]